MMDITARLATRLIPAAALVRAVWPKHTSFSVGSACSACSGGMDMLWLGIAMRTHHSEAGLRPLTHSSVMCLGHGQSGCS